MVDRGTRVVSEEESVQAGEVADAGLKREKARAESGRGRVEENDGWVDDE